MATELTLADLGPLAVRLDRHEEEIVPTTDEPLPGERDVVIANFDRYLAGMSIDAATDLDNGRPKPEWFRRRDRIWTTTTTTPSRPLGIWRRGGLQILLKVWDPELLKYREALLRAHTHFPTWQATGKVPPTDDSLQAQLEEMIRDDGPYSWNYDLSSQQFIEAIRYADVDAALTALAGPVSENNLGPMWVAVMGAPADVIHRLAPAVRELAHHSDTDHLRMELTPALEHYDPELARLIIAELRARQPDDNYLSAALLEGQVDIVRDELRRGVRLTLEPGEPLVPTGLPGGLSARDTARLVTEFDLKVRPGLTAAFPYMPGDAYQTLVAHGADRLPADIGAESEAESGRSEALAAIAEASPDEDMFLERTLELSLDNKDPTVPMAALRKLVGHQGLEDLRDEFRHDLLEDVLQYGHRPFLGALLDAWPRAIDHSMIVPHHTSRVAAEILARHAAGLTDYLLGRLLVLTGERGWLEPAQLLLAEIDSRLADQQYGGTAHAYGLGLVISKALQAAYAHGHWAYAAVLGGPELLREGKLFGSEHKDQKVLRELPTRTIVRLIQLGLPLSQINMRLGQRMATDDLWAVATLSPKQLYDLGGFNDVVVQEELAPIGGGLSAMLPAVLVRYVLRVL